ncbi:hypothetical protein [Paenibacillus sp. yr247]|uniref:hypothetical protein n=1 Tax=Paenibacillus sp. yr247 TaxID=1761880 RepID=UPI000B843AF2|nr:hypothetical protein [Paenibacillus sp. yr247]
MKNGNESSFCVENLGILKNSEFFSGLAISAVAFSYALVPIMSKESRQKADIEKKLKNELHV